jgi:DNA-directed RNA polymerase subunit RPC12/RpoP
MKKKVVGLILSVLIVCTFCTSVFAAETSVQPRAAECPFCGTYGWNVTYVGKTLSGSSEVSCSHYAYGTDVITNYTLIYQGKCRNCGQTMTLTSSDSSTECRGRSHI